jgi:predicted dinucleotide-binding enzyme
MRTVGFIGSGNIGGTLARLAVDAGYDVVLSNSRGPQTLADLVADLGPGARAAAPAEAATAGELVVVSIPPRAYPAVPVQPLASKPELDTINYIPQRDGPIPGLYGGALSSSEVLQRHLGDAHVVKVFNNITFWHLRRLARSAGATDRSAHPSPGDDPIAGGRPDRQGSGDGIPRRDRLRQRGCRNARSWWLPLRVRQRRLRRTVRRAERRAGYPRRRGGTTRRSRRVRTGGHQHEFEYGSSPPTPRLTAIRLVWTEEAGLGVWHIPDCSAGHGRVLISSSGCSEHVLSSRCTRDRPRRNSLQETPGRAHVAVLKTISERRRSCFSPVGPVRLGVLARGKELPVCVLNFPLLVVVPGAAVPPQ